MGVIGLWNLIEDAGTKVNVETLRDKVLAIDLSIWINQSIKGFRDKDGRSVENAHLLGLFYRVSKLLFYHIKPIFVFDGECPTLKLHTLHRRHEKTKNVMNKSKNLSLNVLEKFVSAQLGNGNEPITIVNSTKRKLTNAEKNSFMSELFLPRHKTSTKQVDIYEEFVELSKQFKNRISDDDEDGNEEKKCTANESDDDLQYHHPSHQNIRDIDFNSLEFKSLPPQTRYELLVEIRDSYKGRKNPFPEMLPTDSDVFSNYQMKKLLKKRDLQQEIDKLIDELNGVSPTEFEDVKSLRPMTSSSVTIGGRLASDEGTRFVLIKNSPSLLLPKPPNLSDSEIYTKEEIKNEKDDDLAQDINTANFAYSLPNNLPGYKNEDLKTLDRIEHLASQSNEKESSSKLNSKELIGHLDENVKKYTKLKQFPEQNNESTSLILSDSSDTDDSSGDFIEVPIEHSYSDDEESCQLLLEDVCSLPFNTDYTMDIVVESPKENVTESTNNQITKTNQSSNAKNLEPLVEDIEEIVDDEIPCKPSGDISTEAIKQNEDSKQTTVSEVVSSISDSVPKTTTIEEVPVKELNIEELVQNVKESAKLSRQAATVTQQMISECQELLRLFGVPWLVAPAEAEAQCATLENLGLSDGTITDDSDVFLFAGKTVYRNFFSNSKYIIRYTSEDLEKFYGLKQSKLICLGMMCGTDYTIGIDRVGPVTGLEILSEFPGDDLKPLTEFSRWYREKLFSPTGNHKPENPIRAKLLKLIVPSTFPNRVIYDAYLNPSVNSSQESFSWTSPQLSELRSFATCKFGWSQTKTDSIILPVLKSINEKQVQKRIDFYFSAMPNKKSSISETLRIKRSKRLNEAIRRNIRITVDQFGHSSLDGSTNLNKAPKRPKKRMKKNQTNNSQTKSSSVSLVLSEESSSSSD